MTRKPAFWIVFVLLTIASIIFVGKFFPVAFPIVTLDLTMNREMALQSADELAGEYGWGPEGFRQAASFRLDDEVQSFVELEGGGTEAFRRMIREGLFSPYTWRVRLFREGETNETLVRFTPDGRAYGFAETLPEDEPGAALPTDSARAIAEAAASERWQIDLGTYELVEESQEVRPGERVDHTFVYERPDLRIGEGRYRLRLVTGGDRLTELTHFIKIPEAFTRRYEEMRSANNTISLVSLLAVAILYVLGGCVVGLFLLLRQRWVLWRKPLLWGIFIAVLHVLMVMSNWPLGWMNYDTALSPESYWLWRVVRLLVQFIGTAALMAVVFMAAESLTRKAFPHHPQLWRSWSPGVASSPAILGRTAGGLLIVGLFGAFDIALYAFASRVLGWWTPSGILFEPDVLATHFPWLTSVAASLQAGFLEECLFRAVPIAGAALIGQRLGNRRLWIIGALIVQALVFGSGHANYPQQPAYARVVELIIPSLVFGGMYLWFGLIPAIISHFVVDVAWIGLPLFVSSAPGVWIDKLLVVLLTLVPLWVVIGARLRARRWTSLKEEDLNRGWQPPPRREAVPVRVEPAALPALTPARVRLLIVGGVIGLLVWFLVTDFQSFAPPLRVVRRDAIDVAERTLAERGIELPEPWQVLGQVRDPNGLDDRFIWQEGGSDAYEALMGTYLTPPHWRTRFVRFQGDVAERAEEYQVYVSRPGEVMRFSHILPEAREGAALTEDEARAAAHQVVTEIYGCDPATLKEVSVTPSALPARTDWAFTFADTIAYPLEEGEARIGVEIAGSEVADSYRYVHVPEEWARHDRNRRNVAQVVETLCIMLTALVVVAGVGTAIVAWSRRTFSVRNFVTFFVIFAALSVFHQLNAWPARVAWFSTAEPFRNQAFTNMVFPIVWSLLLSLGLALVIGFAETWRRSGARAGGLGRILAGFSVGALIAGILALIALAEPSLRPFWGNYQGLDAALPIVASAMQPLGNFFLEAVFLVLVIVAVDRFTQGWTRKRALFSILLVLTVLVFSGRSVDSVPFWFLSGIIGGVVVLLAYLVAFRYEPALIPPAVGSIAILGALRQAMIHVHPAAIPGAVLALLIVAAISVYWCRRLMTE